MGFEEDRKGFFGFSVGFEGPHSEMIISLLKFGLSNCREEMTILDMCTVSYPMILWAIPPFLVSCRQAVVLIDRRIYHVEIH